MSDGNGNKGPTPDDLFRKIEGDTADESWRQEKERGDEHRRQILRNPLDIKRCEAALQFEHRQAERRKALLDIYKDFVVSLEVRDLAAGERVAFKDRLAMLIATIEAWDVPLEHVLDIVGDCQVDITGDD